jgi:hypothetical protein
MKLSTIMAAFITYAGANAIITSVITGTGAGDNLITSIGPIALAGLVVFAITKGFGGKH